MIRRLEVFSPPSWAEWLRETSVGSPHSAIAPPVVQAVLGFSCCSLGVLSVLTGSGALILLEIVPFFFPCSSEAQAFAEFFC